VFHRSTGSRACYLGIEGCFDGTHVGVSITLKVDDGADVVLRDEAKLLSIAIQYEVANVATESKGVFGPEKLSEPELASTFERRDTGRDG